jgi:hypothetical protein
LSRVALPLLLLLPVLSYAQNQLVLIKNDEVVIRFREGDDINYNRKSSNQSLRGFIVTITDSTIITSNDTVATHQIERLLFSKGNFMNVVGTFLVAGGSLLFVIDQFNNSVVNGDKPSLDGNVSRITLTSLAVGLPMMLIKRKSHRVGFRKRLKIVDKNSPFYYSEARFHRKGFQSPHIPRN